MPASSSLPVAEWLIHRATAEIEKVESLTGDSEWPARLCISKAWVYLGNEVQALRWALNGDPSDRAVALATIAETQSRLSGYRPKWTMSPQLQRLSKGEEDDISWLVLWSLAISLAEADQPNEAWQAAREIPIGRGTAQLAAEALGAIAAKFWQRGEADSVVQVVEQAAALLEAYPKLYDEELLLLASLTRLAVRSKQLELANRLRRQAFAVHDTTIKHVEIGSSNSRMLSAFQIALICFVIGDDEAGQRWLKTTLLECDLMSERIPPDEQEFRQPDEDRDRWRRCQNIVKMARKLCEFGLSDKVADWLNYAAVQTEGIQSARTRNAALEMLALASFELGFDQYGDRFQPKVTGALWQQSVWHDRAEVARVAGRLMEAQHYLEAASRLMVDISEDEQPDYQLAKLGEAWVLCGDVARGRAYFSQALNADDPSNGAHQEIARKQIKVGLLGDAYDTICRTRPPVPQSIDLMPIAELAEAVAKLEYERRHRASTKTIR